MPLFVRGGSIVPVALDDVSDNSDIEKKDDGKSEVMSTKGIKILRFPAADGSCEPFELYEDDGDGYEYLDGKYEITVLR